MKTCKIYVLVYSENWLLFFNSTLTPGIYLDLMHLKKPGGFDIALFYRDIINTAEDEDLGVQFDESSKLEDLMKKVRAKETRKRALSRWVLRETEFLPISCWEEKIKKPVGSLFSQTDLLGYDTWIKINLVCSIKLWKVYVVLRIFWSASF